MKTLHRAAIAAIALLACQQIHASDFGLWTGASAEKKLGMFTLSVDGGLRLQNDLKSVDRWSAAFGVSFKPVKYVEIGAEYSFIYKYKTESRENKYESWIEQDADGNDVTVSEYEGYNLKKPYWRCRNRWSFDVTGKLPVGRFTFSLRERYQLTRDNHVKSPVDKYRTDDPDVTPVYSRTDIKDRPARSESRLRSRLKADYDIRHCPLQPYAYLELTNSLDNAMQWDKTRVGVGAELKITKRHRLDMGYVYQYSKDNDYNGTLHAIDISYKYKF